MRENAGRGAAIAVALIVALGGTACKRDGERGDGTGPGAAREGEPAKTVPPERPPVEQPPVDTPPAETPPDTPADKVPLPCETLDRAECISAVHCTLDWIEDGKYACRASAGPCEVGLVQTDKPSCEAREGCRWDPGSCYCPFPGYGQTQVPDKQDNAGGACACGGGPAPRCRSAE